MGDPFVWFDARFIKAAIFYRPMKSNIVMGQVYSFLYQLQNLM